MIPQARKKWLVRFLQHDGVVVEMVEKFLQGFAKRLRERGGRRGVVRLGLGEVRPSPPLLFI